MKHGTLLLALLLAGGAVMAQRHKIGEVNAEKPEGQLLQQIGQEADEAKKLALLEKFISEFPKHEATGWVYEQMQALYLKANQPDKAIDVGAKLVAMDPEDVEAAHQNLKAAESKKDAALIKQWAMQTSQAAAKVAASQQPKDEDEVDNWKRRVDYAKQVKNYADYSLYAAALQAPDPKQKIELVEALIAQNPQSEYVPKSMDALFLAYRQTGQNDKAVALAEKVLATDQSNEDMLLVVASDYLQKKGDPEKVLAYTAKIIEVLNAKPKPAGVADAEWQKHKDLYVGIAHFMNGTVEFNQNKFSAVDSEMRAALPLIQGNAGMHAEALYRLGFANYKMEKIQEAANYYRECAAIKSPFQATAARNLNAIKTQYRGVK